MDLLRVYDSVGKNPNGKNLEDAARATFYSDLAARVSYQNISDTSVTMPFLSSDAEIPETTWDLPVAELLHKSPHLIGTQSSFFFTKKKSAPRNPPLNPFGAWVVT